MSLRLELLFGCVLISAGIASAQTVYSVPPNTKGNQLDLTVVNESPTALAVQLEVKAIKYPTTVTFRAVTQTIESIAPQSERSATFTFDVGRPVSANTTDSLDFLITDRSGAAWHKSIIIKYTPPAVFALEQNFPNPFNPSTTIYYQLPIDGRVSLKVYNVLGQEVTTLFDEQQSAGYHEARLDASTLASGLYFYRMSAGNFTAVRKLMVIK